MIMFDDNDGDEDYLGWLTSATKRLPNFFQVRWLSSTQPCIPPGSLNRVPASIRNKGEKVTGVGWQVTLFGTIWHVVISITNCYIGRFTYLLVWWNKLTLACG